MLATVLLADDDFVAVNKPPGVWLEEGFEDEPSVLRQLVLGGTVGPNDLLEPVYPVDASLSGACILARTEAALTAFRRQIANSVLTVTCLALVRGCVDAAEGEVDAPILDPGPVSGRLRIDHGGGEPSRTHWRLLDRFVGAMTLECRPSTANPNQVRVHLASMGMPLVVDATYGGAADLMLSSFKADFRPSRRKPERALIDRPSLHVSSVAFRHPLTGAATSIDAELPKDLRAALHQLDKYGRLP